MITEGLPCNEIEVTELNHWTDAPDGSDIVTVRLTWQSNRAKIEIAKMNDWLSNKLLCMRVVTWLVKDCHSNEIEDTDHE